MTIGSPDDVVPEEIKEQLEEAKKKPNETTIIRFNEQYDDWYIFVEKGYVVDRIERDGKEGIVYLKQASAEKSQNNILAVAQGYLVDTLKIEYE